MRNFDNARGRNIRGAAARGRQRLPNTQNIDTGSAIFPESCVFYENTQNDTYLDERSNQRAEAALRDAAANNKRIQGIPLRRDHRLRFARWRAELKRSSC